MYHKNINISDNFNLIETFAFLVISSHSASIQKLYYGIVQATACYTVY